MALPQDIIPIIQAGDVLIQAVPPGIIIPRTEIPALFSKRHFMTGRGAYRIFNTAGYRFYWGTSIPTDSDSFQESNATLPYESTDTFTDGTYYFAVKYFNGVILSPFKPIGPNGEQYLRLVLDSGTEKENPPEKPLDVFLEQIAGGKIRVHAAYFEIGDLRADEFCITYTTNGSDPAEDTPDDTVAIAVTGPAILTDGSSDGYDIDTSAQAQGTTIKVRVQMRRDAGGGDFRYSDTDSTDILSITTDKTGPAAPDKGDAYPGALSEKL